MPLQMLSLIKILALSDVTRWNPWNSEHLDLQITLFTVRQPVYSFIISHFGLKYIFKTWNAYTGCINHNDIKCHVPHYLWQPITVMFISCEHRLYYNLCKYMGLSIIDVNCCHISICTMLLHIFLAPSPYYADKMYLYNRSAKLSSLHIHTLML